MASTKSPQNIYPSGSELRSWSALDAASRGRQDTVEGSMEDLRAFDGMTPSIPGDSGASGFYSCRRCLVRPRLNTSRRPEVVQAQEWRLDEINWLRARNDCAVQTFDLIDVRGHGFHQLTS